MNCPHPLALLIVLTIGAFGSKPILALDTPLADAIQAGRFDEALRLLEGDVNVDAPQADGTRALHWAVRYDRPELFARLIDVGADVHARNRLGVFPLSLACQNGNAPMVEALLAAGADPNSALAGGETVLMTAARTGRLEVVEQLIAAGADVNAKEHNGQTALMWAAAEGNADVVEALIDAGAKVDTKLRSGFSAFFFAIREGRAHTVHRFLENGCDVNAIMASSQRYKFGRDRVRMTPLLIAVENGHFELARDLLEKGADPNASPTGYSALHALTWVRKPIRGDGDPSPIGSGNISSLDMVRLLVAGGADPNQRLSRGKSELGRFTYSGSTAFLLAAQAGDLPLAQLLIELGADPTIPNADGTTPLLAATGVGALGDGDESAGTEDEAIAMVEYLLQLGADINAVDDNGETAVHGAAYQSLPKLFEYLVLRGADPSIWNRENRAGWTPLVIATGYRPGNFRPAPTTIAVIRDEMRRKGITIPDTSKIGGHKRSWSAARNENDSWIIRDVTYAEVDDTWLKLDLHFPLHVSGSKLVVWVHGGAWREGSKSSMPLTKLVEQGFTVASVDYRLSPVAQFPAQVHDIKAAIRFLRYLAPRYGFQVDRIAIAGASAGGHLAALVGVSNGNEELEGDVGQHLDQASDVHAIIDLYGPTNLTSILSQSTPHGLSVRVPALKLLLGDLPENVAEMAKIASPVAHVDSNDPPLLLIHGDQDPQVPLEQSVELLEAYQSCSLPVQFLPIPEAGHGGDVFYDDAQITAMVKFLSDQVFTE